MLRRTGVLWAAASAATALAWGLTATGAAADGAIGCGSAITEDTVLTQDLLDCEDGLTIAAPDVTLDLGGHQIAGRGAGSGVLVDAPEAVVRNGTITGFGVGVGFGFGTSETTVSHLDLSSNGVGVDRRGGSGLRIENNTIHDNGDGLFMVLVESLQIVDNRILGNGRFGIFAFDRPVLVQGNLVMRNGADGIHLDTAHTIAIGNTSSRNGGAGIWLYDPNCAHLNFFRLGSNLTDGNEGLGIDVELPGGCTPEITPFDLLDAGGNAANRNGDPRECTIYVECGRNRGQANKLMPLDPAAMPERHADDDGSGLAEALLRAENG